MSCQRGGRRHWTRGKLLKRRHWTRGKLLERCHGLHMKVEQTNTNVTTAPPWTMMPFLSSTGREHFASLLFTYPHPPRHPTKRKFWPNWTIYPHQLPIRLGHLLLPLSRQHQLCPVQVVSQGGHFILLMISFCLKVHDIQYLTLSTVEKKPE
jgi:hypothetical protein